jgi:hypothetical protein
MFILYGKKATKFKDYNDNQRNCMYCSASDLNVKAEIVYFHIFYLPIFPFGSKLVQVRCNKCGELNRNTQTIDYYKSVISKPLYVYTGLILLASFIVFMFIINLKTQNQKKTYVNAPKVNDVYQIRNDYNDTTSYYFLRINKISNDTVTVYHNNLEYFTFTTGFDESDYFLKNEEMLFTKNDLKEMLEKDQIISVERDYNLYSKFNKIK